jgi:hypothetical protein
MNITTTNIAGGTDTSWATRRPRTLEELLEREEKLATQGLVEEAELVGGDVLDLLNVGLHFRRRPVGTSAAIAGAIAFLFTRIGRARSRNKVRSFFARRPPPSGGGTWSALVRNFVGSSLAGAVVSRIGGFSSRPTHFGRGRF